MMQLALFRTLGICLFKYVRMKLQKSGIRLSVKNGIYNKFSQINTAFNTRSLNNSQTFRKIIKSLFFIQSFAEREKNHTDNHFL